MFIMAVPVDVWAICVLPVKFVHRFCFNNEQCVGVGWMMHWQIFLQKFAYKLAPCKWDCMSLIDVCSLVSTE